MKNLKNKNLTMFLTVAVFFMVVIAAHAQVPTGPGIDDTTPAPIDGLIGLAMMAGAFFGGKKLRGSKKN